MSPATCPPCLRSKHGPARPAAPVGIAERTLLARMSRHTTTRASTKRSGPCRPAGGLTVVPRWRRRLASRGRVALLTFAAMSKWRRWLAIAIALYLLLVLLDRFVLVELFFRRTGIALGAALLEAFALVGCGFAVRTVVRSSFFVVRSSGEQRTTKNEQRTTFPWGELDVTRDLLVGYPI